MMGVSKRGYEVTKRLRIVAVWTVVALLVIFYSSLLLTNGHFGDFFLSKAWGSNLYSNVWVHLIHGNLLIDPQYAPGEYFITGAHRFVVYFGIMPAMVRGVISIVAHNLYAHNFTNLSMVMAVLLGAGSVAYAIARLVGGNKKLWLIGGSLVAALILASPISYLLAWSWTYHEVILWGIAWALLFVSIFTLWIFDKKLAHAWHGLLLGLAAGMALLCRPTVALTLCVPYAWLVGRSLWQAVFQRHFSDLKKLLPGMLAALVLVVLAGFVNYERWGSPFTFVKLDQNVQFVTLYPQRGKDLQQAGEFNLKRVPSSILYYEAPTASNFSAHFPFVTLDSKLTLMNHAPQYDYVEGSRLPLLLSMPYLLLLAVGGIYSAVRFKREEKVASLWLLGGGAVTALSILSVYAVALRYSAEFVPTVVFLALLYLVALSRKLTKLPSLKWSLAFGAVFVISVYITPVTTLGYKEFIWDIPTGTRQHLRAVIHYTPTAKDTKHIIDGVRFPVY